MSRALVRWIVTTLAVLSVPYFVTGVHVAGFGAALAFALVLGILNTLVRPVLLVLTLPLTFMSLGLFLLVINAFIFKWAGALVGGVTVDGFGAAFIAALVVSIISWVMDFATGSKQIPRVVVKTHHAGPAQGRAERNVGGPTIDLRQDGDDHWG